MYVCMHVAGQQQPGSHGPSDRSPPSTARTNSQQTSLHLQIKLQTSSHGLSKLQAFKLQASFKRSNFKPRPQQASSVQTSSKLQAFKLEATASASFKASAAAHVRGGGRDLAITLTLPLTLTVALILDLTLAPTLALNHTVTHTLSHTLTTALTLTLTHVGREAVVEADQLRRDASIGQASICRC